MPPPGVMLLIAALSLAMFAGGKIVHLKPVQKTDHAVCRVVTLGAKCKPKKEKPGIFIIEDKGLCIGCGEFSGWSWNELHDSGSLALPNNGKPVGCDVTYPSSDSVVISCPMEGWKIVGRKH